jgi:hypothetical protein
MGKNKELLIGRLLFGFVQKSEIKSVPKGSKIYKQWQ